jgi:hypothetical protein
MAISDFESILKGQIKDVSKINLAIEKRMAEMYRESYRQVRGMTQELFADLGGDVSLAEAHKRARLDNLLTNIAKEYKKSTGKALDLAIDGSARNYTESFYRYAFSADKAIGLQLQWGVLPVDAIRASVFSEQSGLTIIKTWAKNTTVELANIQSALTRGIASGSSYLNTAESIKGQFERGLNDALRVVRTESHRAFSEGHLAAHDKAEELGLDVVKVWVATLDNRTRDDHGAMDGQEADKDGYFTAPDGSKALGPGLFGIAAQDISCRCVAIDELREYRPTTRRVDKEVEGNITFREWAEPQGWTQEKGWPKAGQALK